MKPRELSTARISRVFKPAVHLNRQIPPEPHTAMYVWHKYWSRKTWNVVGEFIKTYTRENDVVFDPFAGSGVVAIEAVRNRRRAIVCDLNPVAGMITDLTLRPVKLLALQQAFECVRERVQKKIEALYQVECVKCGKPVVAACFVREGDEVVEVRYPGCPHCGHRCETGCKQRKSDTEALKEMERKKIKEWYPKHRLYYIDGTPFMKKEHYDSLDQLFTKRNLQAAAWLYEAIQSESSPQLRRFLMGAFTSMIHLCTRMMPVCEPAPTHHATPFSSPGWTQHSYWSAPRYMEQNVWDKYESAVAGHQGVINAKKESQALPKVKLTEDWRDVLDGRSDIAVITGDCVKLMDDMPENSIDYIFTDPPYDASIQYGELSYLWNAWLKENGHYGERLVTYEIIRNERQQKSFEVYHSLLSNSFKGFFKVLRAGRYLTVTFHNPTFKIRNATVRAGVFAGFDYQQIHHQPLARTSPKALLQPFGSADGDFYLRFQNTGTGTPKTLEEVTEERFRRIVIETCKGVIAERAEPTPYTLLINFVDPVLAQMGLFGTLQTGLDVKTVLQEAIGNEFCLVKSRIGSAEGQLWWLNDPVFVARLQETPLSERVEEMVFRCLNERGRVTFTQVWDTVSIQFPNSLTPDSLSIKEALEIYARPVSKGIWMLREEIRQHIRTHAEIIALLALIGKRRGFDIWIGRNEQGSRSGGFAPDAKLSSFVTTHASKLDQVTNIRTVLDMDLLWLKGNRVETAFEVEATTSMTSGLLRGSNLPAATKKIMVLPEERESDFQRKMASPLFNHHFANESWNLLYFNALRQAYSKTKDATVIEKLTDVKAPPPKADRVREPAQTYINYDA